MKENTGRSTAAGFALAFLAFCVFTVLLTWPLAAHLSDRSYMIEPSGDQIGSMSYVWYQEYAISNDLPRLENTMIGYPFGVNYRAYPVSITTFAGFLSVIFGFVRTYNLMLLILFPLGGAFMWLLIFYITKSGSAGFIAGFAYTFSSWHLMRATEHLSLCAIFCFPLTLLCLIHFWKRRSVASAIFLAVSLAIPTLSDPHYFYFTLIIMVIWLIFMITMDIRQSNPFPRIDKRLGLLFALSILVSGLLSLPAFRFIFYSNPRAFSEYTTRNTADAIANSARPWMYVIPPYHNPFLGRLFRGFTGTHSKPLSLTDASAYLGILPSALGIYAAWEFFKQRMPSKKRPGGKGDESNEQTHEYDKEKAPDLNDREIKAIAGFAAVLGITAFLLSLPPEWHLGGSTLPWITKFQQLLVPFFRGYSRLAILVIFSVTVLAGIGWSLLQKRFNTKPLRAALFVAVATVLILADFTISPPSRAIGLPEYPQVLSAVEKLPGKDAIAIYPLARQDDYRTYNFSLFQSRFQHPMMNGAQKATLDDLYRMAALNPYSGSTPGILKANGIDYVVVLPEYFKKTADLRDTDYQSFEPGRMKQYKLVEKKGNGYLYKITDAPARVIPLYYTGFLPPAMLENGEAWAAMVDKDARIMLDVRKSGDYLISLNCLNPEMDRMFSVGIDENKYGDIVLPSGNTSIPMPAINLEKGEHFLDIGCQYASSKMPTSAFRAPKDTRVYLYISEITVAEP